MVDLEIVPNKEKMGKEVKKIGKLLEQKLKESEKEEGLDKLRNEIREAM